MQCLNKTRPGFDIEKIPDYFISPDEYTLINLLAIILKDLEGLPKAINIWRKLKGHVELSSFKFVQDAS